MERDTPDARLPDVLRLATFGFDHASHGYTFLGAFLSDANPIWPSGAVERFRCGTNWNIQAYGSSLCDLGISEVSMGTTLFRASHHLLRNASTIAAEKAVE